MLIATGTNPSARTKLGRAIDRFMIAYRRSAEKTVQTSECVITHGQKGDVRAVMAYGASSSMSYNGAVGMHLQH